MNAESILNAIRASSNTSLVVNSVMHLLVLGALLVLFFIPASRAKKYVFNSVLLILAVSVAGISIVNGNPFNLITFLIIAIISIVELVRGKNQVSKLKINFNTVISFVFIVIGFCYPEFVKANALVLPFVSPLGAIPCPTFLVILGMLNLSVPQVNKPQFVVTNVLALFYGVTGVLQLRVYLDIALLALVMYSFYNFRFVFAKKRSSDFETKGASLAGKYPLKSR